MLRIFRDIPEEFLRKSWNFFSEIHRNSPELVTRNFREFPETNSKEFGEFGERFLEIFIKIVTWVFRIEEMSEVKGLMLETDYSFMFIHKCTILNQKL